MVSTRTELHRPGSREVVTIPSGERAAARSSPWQRAAVALAVMLAGAPGCGSPGPSAPPGWPGRFDVASVQEFLRRAPGMAAELAAESPSCTRWLVLLWPGDDAPPIEATQTVWLDGANRERREWSTEGAAARTVVQWIDGERFLETEDGRATGRDLAHEIAGRRRYRGLLRDAATAPPGTWRLVAPPADGGAATIVLERDHDGGERWQLWLDARTGLATRIARFTRDASGEHVDEERLDQHARAGARVVARHQVTLRDGRRLREAWLLERREGEPPDPALFAFPGD